MSRLNYIVATCVLALTVGAANANTITTFNVSGTFAFPLPGLPLSGTLTVDVTTGTLTAADLVVPTFQDFTILSSSFSPDHHFGKSLSTTLLATPYV